MQEKESPKINNYKSEIITIYKPKDSSSTNTDHIFPDYDAKILEGDSKGKIIKTYSNGFDYKVGDKVYLEQSIDTDGKEYYSLGEIVRYDSIFMSLFLFVGVIVVIFGKKGLKALLSLAVSLSIIFFVLLPITLKGYNPVIVAGLVSMLLLSCLMLITHGKNRVTYSAIIGCSVSVFITIILSYITIINAKITGYVDDTSSYLYFSTNGQIDFTLLVIASIIIGVIGVVDDGAITQASVVSELKETDPNLSNFEYYKKAMNIGSDHAGAMINTLVLAYVGSALPLMLLFYTTDFSAMFIINKEIVSVEIFRSLIGSVGLLLAIPLTTIIAVYFVKGKNQDDKNLNISNNNHTHSHTHNHKHINNNNNKHI